MSETVSTDFITANRTEGGATIRQFTGSELSAEILLDPAQVTFVLDQLSPRTQDAERYNQRGDYTEHLISMAGGDGDDDAPKDDLPNEYPQHMPRGTWLWPDDRTGMEWANKHDERL